MKPWRRPDVPNEFGAEGKREQAFTRRMPYHRPVLASDLSEAASAAARIAPRVVAPDAEGSVLMVIQPPEVPPHLPPELMDEVAEIMARKANDARAALRSWIETQGLGGWRADVIEDTSIPRAIVATAHTLHADVIVVGDHGGSGLARALLGSVARGVLHRSDTDVVVARAPEGPLRRVLVATDLQPPSLQAIRRAQDIAHSQQARLTLMHSLDVSLWGSVQYPFPPSNREDMRRLRKHIEDAIASLNAAYCGGLADELVAQGPAATTIVAQARERHADLVVLGSHGGGAIERAILGSVADAVAERAACSVLVVRRPPERVRGKKEPAERASE